MAAGAIRVGIGGWTFEPWRGAFYPDGLPQKRELAYAAERLTAIEINATFYGAQKPESFRKWASETPENFVFAVKGPRFATQRRVLAEGAESVARFLDGGVTELGAKLGPILWQLPATKRFDPDDLGGFLKLLPAERHGVRLRHAVEARHESFGDPRFVDMLRAAEADVAQVVLDDPDHPMIADVTADFVYLRLERAQEEVETGYAEEELDAWAKRLAAYAKGETPIDLPALAAKAPEGLRDVYAFFISGAKVRNPAAAQAMIARLDG
ncbi:DUF72 domain-containing protein [Methylopila turkensis]|uniref:DUF72 domain-containing protein n=1 Tax=Methylopila turkensis TaxID=1437816 RepID=A0A9W6JQM8_9HYPH|nr:DUF72 domain-containing protein [Methylopila turkensis]GLK81487.1 hypothetical protein GCM10008174_32280 [Methylopila turkensis]